MSKYLNKQNLLAITIALFYGMLIRGLFGWGLLQNWYSVMSITFLVVVPFAVGALTIFFSDSDIKHRMLPQIFLPWIPVFLFLVLTLLLKIECLACWGMALPIFLLLSSIGGLLAGFVKGSNYYIAAIALLPLLTSPIEQHIGSSSKQYMADTYIDIDAQQLAIWQNMTSVKEIKAENDEGMLTKSLGFPRPLKAELNYDGLGATRKALFTNGMVFREEVIGYDSLKTLVFSVKANPEEIPCNIMDEHVAIGGRYFNVVSGTYELKQLKEGKFRLRFFTVYTLNTTFNAYAAIWAELIMKDIQHNILQVIKKRAEAIS